MTLLEEKIVKWALIKAETEAWVKTLARKYRIGETIYTQLNKILASIVEDLELLEAPDQNIEFLINKLKEVEEWKKSAIEVMPDFQAIGAEMDVRLGETVHDKILPYIKRLKQELEQQKQHATE